MRCQGSMGHRSVAAAAAVEQLLVKLAQSAIA